MIRIEHDVITNKITEIELSADEIADIAKRQELAQTRLKSAEKDFLNKDAAKQAVLDKLGLTADEVAALLG